MRRDPYGNQLLVRMHYKHGQYWYVYAISCVISSQASGHAGLHNMRV